MIASAFLVGNTRTGFWRARPGLRRGWSRFLEDAEHYPTREAALEAIQRSQSTGDLEVIHLILAAEEPCPSASS
jgi:hypothetical protein